MRAARQQSLKDILDKYSDLMKDEMDIFKGIKATIHTKLIVALGSFVLVL